MKGNESNSGSSTAATSPSGPPQQPGEAHHGNGKKPKEPSEAEFLAKQAKDAKAAMSAAWGDLTHSLKNAGDVTQWAKRYPWISTGAAAVAGFVASYALIPVTKEEAKEKWQHLKSAVTGVRSSDFNAVEVDGDQIEIEPPPKPQTEPPAKGMLAMVMAEVFKTLRPALISLLGSAVGGKIAQPPDHESEQDAYQPPRGDVGTQAGSDL